MPSAIRVCLKVPVLQASSGSSPFPLGFLQSGELGRGSWGGGGGATQSPLPPMGGLSPPSLDSPSGWFSQAPAPHQLAAIEVQICGSVHLQCLG